MSLPPESETHVMQALLYTERKSESLSISSNALAVSDNHKFTFLSAFTTIGVWLSLNTCKNLWYFLWHFILLVGLYRVEPYSDSSMVWRAVLYCTLCDLHKLFWCASLLDAQLHAPSRETGLDGLPSGAASPPTPPCWPAVRPVPLPTYTPASLVLLRQRYEWV